MTDELVQRAQNGDEQAFEELVLIHQRKVYNLALRITGSCEDAKDVSQEAFLRAYRGLPGFRGESSFGTWLYRLTVHTCGDFLRKEKRHSDNVVPLYTENSDGEEYLLQIPDLRYTPESALERQELADAVAKAMDEMPEDYRSALSMREIGGLSYEEIGEELSLKAGTVKSRIFRAREHLRKALIKNGNFYPDDTTKSRAGR
ncbi:MAG: sigma-70 family RNA polymerase sigma factor [Oscillospiraceae bacterium]|nr:sigma-70 family RNA polymerase sigma factor [Oscillospiraceae bacterium]